MQRITLTTDKKSKGISQEQLKQFDYNIKVDFINDIPEINSYLITIKPSYKICNFLGMPLLVQQKGVEEKLLIMPGECKNFHWPSFINDKLISLLLCDNNDSSKLQNGERDWNSSSTFDIDATETILIEIFHTQLRKSIILKVTKRAFNDCLYVIIERDSLDIPSFKIENYCDNLAIKYRQDKFTYSKWLMPNQCSSFGWIEPYSPHKIRLSLIYIADNGLLIQMPTDILVDIDKLDNRNFVKVSNNIIVLGVVCTEGITKVVKFSTVPYQTDTVGAEEQGITELKLGLPGLGISLISKVEEKRVELLYIYIDDITWGVRTSCASRIMKLQLKNIEIDNQSSYKTLYPIILISGASKNKNVISLFVVQRHKITSISYFDEIKLEIQPLQLQLDSDMVYNLSNFYSSITNVKNKEAKEPEIEPEIFSKMQNNKEENKIEIADIEMPNLERAESEQKEEKELKNLLKDEKIYIKSLILSKIAINVSYFETGKKNKSKSKSFIKVLFQNISHAPIDLKPLAIEDTYASKAEIFQILTKEYKSSLFKTVLKVIGSTDLLGNPLNLYNTLLEGFIDFAKKPYNGFKEGPGAFILESIEGASSLVLHSIKGTFETTGKVASTFSKGLITLSNDQDYAIAHEQRMNMEKKRNIIDGIGFGISNFIDSSKSAAIGLVKEPIVGYKKQGNLGIAKGALFGLMGVALKPLSGCLDMIYGTSEGIKNMFTLEISKNDRIRFPRRFYYVTEVFKDYSLEEAVLGYYLQWLKNGKYLECHYISSIKYERDERDHVCYMLLLNSECLVNINVQKKEVIFEIPRTAHIRKWTILVNGIEIIYKKSMKSYKVVIEVSENIPKRNEIAEMIKEFNRII